MDNNNISSIQPKDRNYYIARFWGDPGPYSEVYTRRETRIIDDTVSRDVYYMFANINPSTIEILREYRDLVKDEKILQIIDDVQYVNDDEGYRWEISDKLEDDEDADRQRITATDMIMKIHKIAQEIFNGKFPS